MVVHVKRPTFRICNVRVNHGKYVAEGICFLVFSLNRIAFIVDILCCHADSESMTKFVAHGAYKIICRFVGGKGGICVHIPAVQTLIFKIGTHEFTDSDVAEPVISRLSDFAVFNNIGSQRIKFPAGLNLVGNIKLAILGRIFPFGIHDQRCRTCRRILLIIGGDKNLPWGLVLSVRTKHIRPILRAGFNSVYQTYCVPILIFN